MSPPHGPHPGKNGQRYHLGPWTRIAPDLTATKRVNRAIPAGGAPCPDTWTTRRYKDPDEFLQNQSRIELMERD